MPDPTELGRVLRRIRTRPRPEDPEGLSMAEAARRTDLWATPAISSSYWAQAERGDSTPTAQVLLRMTLACDAAPAEIRDAFRAAGYGYLHDTLVGLGGSPGNLPDTADAGILADPRLPYDKRLALLDHLGDVLDAIETRTRRAAAEPEPGSPGPPDSS